MHGVAPLRRGTRFRLPRPETLRRTFGWAPRNAGFQPARWHLADDGRREVVRLSILGWKAQCRQGCQRYDPDGVPILGATEFWTKVKEGTG